MASTQFDFLILCGGRGSRMQGQDKPLLSYHDEPMVSHVATSVPTTTQTWISANRNTQTYAQWGKVFSDKEVLEELKVESSGPLVGILGGLQRCESEWLLVSPGDTPCLKQGWYLPLIESTPPDAVVIHDGERQQNLHLMLAKNLENSLRDYLSTGGQKVWEWLNAIAAEPVPTPVPEQFANINTESDLLNSPPS